MLYKYASDANLQKTKNSPTSGYDGLWRKIIPFNQLKEVKISQTLLSLFF